MTVGLELSALEGPVLLATGVSPWKGLLLRASPERATDFGIVETTSGGGGGVLDRAGFALAGLCFDWGSSSPRLTPGANDTGPSGAKRRLRSVGSTSWKHWKTREMMCFDSPGWGAYGCMRVVRSPTSVVEAGASGRGVTKLELGNERSQ